MNETVVAVIGNLTADPILTFTQNGLAVVNMTIASTPKTFDKAKNEYVDGEALFLRASCWREFAEHVAGSLTKGMRVIAQGRLRQRSYQDKDGVTRTSIELEVDEIGPSLRFATAQVTRSQSSQGAAVGRSTHQAGEWASDPIPGAQNATEGFGSDVPF